MIIFLDFHSNEKMLFIEQINWIKRIKKKSSIHSLENVEKKLDKNI